MRLRAALNDDLWSGTGSPCPCRAGAERDRQRGGRQPAAGDARHGSPHIAGAVAGLNAAEVQRRTLRTRESPDHPGQISETTAAARTTNAAAMLTGRSDCAARWASHLGGIG